MNTNKQYKSYMNVNKLSGNRTHFVDGVGRISTHKNLRGERRFALSESKRFHNGGNYKLGTIANMIYG